MNNVRILVESVGCGIGDRVRVVVQSQGEPRKQLLAFETSRKELVGACWSSGGDELNKLTYIYGQLTQAS